MATERKTGIQVARETKQELDLLRRDVESLATDVEDANLTHVRERVSTLERQVLELQNKLDASDTVREKSAVLAEKVARLEKQLESVDSVQRSLAVLESQQGDLRKAKEESDKRQWQFVYIFAGAMATLVVTVIVQLVLALVKKP